MQEKIKILITYQVQNRISDSVLCASIGITRATFDNIKKGLYEPKTNTIKLIDDFIEKIK